MGSFRFGIALLVLISVATAKDVFRYDDVETGQSHYMTGDPGKSVEGGWEFTNPDGTFNLVYTADEGGFQPKADHIPVPVEDTKEVDDAKAKFYTLFEEQKAKVKAAKAVVDARRKRSPKDVFRYEEEDQSHYMTGDPGKAVEGGWTFTNPEGTYELVYKADEMGFQPEAAHIPVPVEDTNEVVDARAKFYSLYDEHKAKVEAVIAEDAAAVVNARRKRSPQDVFRYEDADGSHYMTGEPGKAVEGGWTFTNPEGTYELVYKADEMGFQPKADHIPIPVEDTNEVVDAKAKFYSLYDEHKAKVEAAKAVVDARRKRSPKDVFRYEEADQSHYMTGEPGKAVEGGWTFTNPEGSYELVYTADEMGFQPKAAHIPVPVENTNEVVDATAKFYSLYNEHKAKVEAAIAEDAAAVVDARRKKREAHGVHPKFKFHPYYGYVPKDAKEEVEEPKEFKFLPYHGFVPADETVEGEEKFLETLHPYHKKMTEKRFKLDPYYGFVPILENEPEVKYHPYYGFVPVEEEPKEVKEFKFLPYHGFVPADKVIEGEEALLKNLHPYHQKMASKKFKLDPYYGFVPIMEDDAPAAVSERKKRDTETVEKSQDLTLPPHPYNFHPFLGLGAVKPEDSENKLYKYIPYYGFVPAEKDEENEEAIEGEEEEKTVLYKYDPLYGFVKADQEIKPLEEQEYKYTPYVGFVPVTGEEEEDVKTYKFNPFYGFVEKTDEDTVDMKDQQYKFVPFYGFVPVNEDGEVEETAKNYGNLKYTFHPYYGFLPTPTDGEVETQLYKLDPVVGFYPSEKTEKDTEEMIEEMTEEVTVEPEEGLELEAKRKKREANPQHDIDFGNVRFIIPQLVQYVPYPFPYQPLTSVPATTPLEKTPGRVATEGKPDEDKEEQKPIVPVLPANQLLLQPVVGYPTIPVATYPVTHVTYPQTMLPENEFPVIPHSEEDDKVGALEF